MTSEVEYFAAGTTFQEFCREFFADKPEALETDEARAFMGAVDRIALYGGECWMRPGNLDDRFVFAALDWFTLNSSPLLDEIAQILSTDSSRRPKLSRLPTSVARSSKKSANFASTGRLTTVGSTKCSSTKISCGASAEFADYSRLENLATSEGFCTSIFDGKT